MTQASKFGPSLFLLVSDDVALQPLAATSIIRLNRGDRGFTETETETDKRHAEQPHFDDTT
jgi:hypothetical protein